MRVIAGSAGGLRLEAPKAGATRPTMDRVKAAIFSSLGDRVINARVLDLFAGTGALGIEALSRGAASATFVENDRAALPVMEQNFIRTKLRGPVRQQDVFDFLAHSLSAELFDIVFADPPYDQTSSAQSFTALLLASAPLREKLAADGVFVLEKRPSEELPEAVGWTRLRAKKYGATEVIFFARSDAPLLAE